MSPATLFLGLSALVYGAFGLAGLFAPAAVVGAAGVTLTPEASVVELRAVYGGAMLGIAVLYVLCMRPDRQRLGLIAVALIAGGPLAGRLLGLVWEPVPPGFAWIAGGEALWLAIAVGLLPRTPARA